MSYTYYSSNEKLRNNTFSLSIEWKIWQKQNKKTTRLTQSGPRHQYFTLTVDFKKNIVVWIWHRVTWSPGGWMNEGALGFQIKFVLLWNTWETSGVFVRRLVHLKTFDLSQSVVLAASSTTIGFMGCFYNQLMCSWPPCSRAFIFWLCYKR